MIHGVSRQQWRDSPGITPRNKESTMTKSAETPIFVAARDHYAAAKAAPWAAAVIPCEGGGLAFFAAADLESWCEETGSLGPAFAAIVRPGAGFRPLFSAGLFPIMDMVCHNRHSWDDR